MSNRLAHETSLYLRQHAHQPVDWYPWGEEAFLKAKRENKIIFLSIGYSACHWCHVMAHECFDNSEIAEFLNQHFVSVKVDREERPDVDSVYMNFCMALNGSGGWPLTVFFTPELHPIFAGTYFPPYDRQGRRGFLSLIQQIQSLWSRDAHAIRQQALNMSSELKRLLAQDLPEPSKFHPRHELILQTAFLHFDQGYGGFGHAPKFPPDSLLRALLAIAVRYQNANALSVVSATLDAMAYGGLFDQLGGGFARYCVDDEWTVPHFEKMLYTQALLALLYADASVVFGNQEYLRVATETGDWVLERMRAPEGRFYSAYDADSDGEEGRYYVWSKAEIVEAVGDKLAPLACEFFEVGSHGNFEGEWSVLRRVRDLSHLADQFSLSKEQLTRKLREIRHRMLQHRELRIAPSRDEKSVLSWNGLMISALVRLAEITHASHYLLSAEQAAKFLFNTLRPKTGVLLRTFNEGIAKVDAVLEDYAFFVQSLLDLYELTFSNLYLNWATELALESFDKFVDGSGVIFTTPADTPDLICRLEDNHDGALPSASAVLLRNLVRLKLLSNNQDSLPDYDAAFSRLDKFVYAMPMAAASAFLALELRDDPVVCEIDGVNTHECDDLRHILGKCFIVNKIIRKKEDSQVNHHKPSIVICARRQCFAPVTNATELKALLDRESLGVTSTM
ncbi:MAG: thioredoxin domain-containing protein [Candidatus Sumerlaeaceae bacterium]|nr:thioredoxin domain-containing protein [Candidatus Sumerlaeaceae bacterium]